MANNEITLKISIDDNGDFKVVASEAKKTAKAVDGVTESTRKLDAATKAAGKGRNAYSKQEKAIHQSGLSAGKQMGKMAQTINGGGGTSLVGAYATLAASIFAITAAFGVLKRAAAFTQLEAGLVATGNAAGTNLPLVAEGLRDITDSAISLKEAMTSVALGVSAGFSTKQMEGLTRVAKGASLALGRDMADAMSRLTRGAAKLEPEILDELGIMVRLDTATQGYADSVGKAVGDLSQFERRMAFTNAIIAQGEEKFSLITESIAANPFDKLSATFEDLTQTVLGFVVKGLQPIVSLLASSPTALLGVLLMFGSTLIKKIVPAIGEVAATQSKVAAQASNDMKISLARQSQAIKKMGRDLPKFDLAPKGVKQLEKALRDGTASSEEMKKTVQSLNRSIRSRTKNLGEEQQKIRGWGEEKKRIQTAELQRQKDLLAAIQKVNRARKGESSGVLGGLAGKAARAKTTSKVARVTAAGLSQMEGQGLAESFKTAAKASKIAGKQFLKTTGTVNKLAAGVRVAGAAVRLFGTAFLQAIPIIGQVITAITLLWSFISPFFEAGEMAKEVDDVIDSFDSLNAIGTQLAVTMQSDASSLEKYTAQLKASTGVLGQLESGMDKIKEKQEKLINDKIIEQYKQLADAQENMYANSDPFAAMMTGVNDGQEQLIKKLQEQKGQLTEDTIKSIKEAQVAFEALGKASGTLSAESVSELARLREELGAGVKTWEEYEARFEAIAGPSKVLMGNLGNVGDAVNGLTKGIKALKDETKNPFDDMLTNLQELSNGVAYAVEQDAKAWGNSTKNYDAYADSVKKSNKEIYDLVIELSGGNRLGENGDLNKGLKLATTQMKTFGEEINTANINARTQGYIMASVRKTAKTNAEDAKTYAEAHNQKIKEEVTVLKNTLAIKALVNASDETRAAIIAQIAAKEAGFVNVAKEVWAVKSKIAVEEQKTILKAEQANLKVLEAKKKLRDLDMKLLAGQLELLDIMKQMGREREVQANLLSGGSGKSSAAQELKTFERQKGMRLDLLAQETKLKLDMVGVEYELLKQRVEVAKQEAIVKASGLDVPAEQGLGRIEEIQNTAKKHIELLSKSEIYTKDAIGAQAVLNELRMDNEGLILAYKATKELKDLNKESVQAVQEGMKAELDARSKLNDLVSKQADTLTSLAKAQAKNRSLKAGADGSIGAKEELAIFNEQKSKREEILKEEKDIKLEMIDLEYKLLLYRLKVSNQERLDKIAQAPQAQQAKLKAEMPSMGPLLAQLERINKLQKASVESASELQEINEDNEGLQKAYNLKQQILAEEQKALEWKDKELQQQEKLLGLIKEEQTLVATSAQERAIIQSFLSGQGGEISAQKEYDLFMEQKEAREAMAEQELVIKTAMIQMEYDLIEQKMRLLEMEANERINALPEKDQEAERAKLPDFEAYIANLAMAEQHALNIANLAFNAESMADFNREMQLANAATAEFYGGLKDSLSIIEDEGIQQIGTAALDGLTKFKQVYDVREAMAKKLAKTELQLEKAKEKKLEAIKFGSLKDIKKTSKKVLEIEAKKTQESTDLKETEERSKLSLASAGAGMTAGILEGLAATQDTTSKSGFEAAKALSMGAAVMSTAAAAMSEYERGGPWAAAAAVAAGAIQIATIASTTFGGGGSTASVPVSGGGAGSSTEGRTGPLEGSTKLEPYQDANAAIAVDSLLALAAAAEHASLSIGKIEKGITDIETYFSDGTTEAMSTLRHQVSTIASTHGRKTDFGFKISGNDTSLSTFNAEFDKGMLVPHIEKVMEEIVGSIEIAAAGISAEVDMSSVDYNAQVWSKRWGGSNAEDRLAQIQKFINGYANAVAATIEGLPETKDWKLGDFEELMRLVGSLQDVNEYFRLTGNAASVLASTLEGADIAANLVELLGGEDNFADAMDLYIDTVLTETERATAALSNAKGEITAITDTLNAGDKVIAAGFSLDDNLSKDEFQSAFNYFTSMLQNADFGPAAATMISGMLEALPDYEIAWEAADTLAAKITDDLKNLNDLEISLMESQGYAYEAVQAQRALEIQELELLEGEYAEATIATQKLIWAQEDLNEAWGLQMTLLETVGLKEEALRLERIKQLASMDPLLWAIQEQIYAVEDAIKVEQELTKARSDAEAVLRKSYKASVDALKDDFKELSEDLKEKIKDTGKSISILSSAVSSLTTASNSMEKVSKASIANAREELNLIKAKALLGDYSGFEDMDAPLSILTADNSELYSTLQEFNFAQAQNQVAIDNLKEVSGSQLTIEEEILDAQEKALQTLKDNHEDDLKLLKDQLNATLKISDAIVDWDTARALYKAADDKVVEQQAEVERLRDEVRDGLLKTMVKALTGLDYEDYLKGMDYSLSVLAGLSKEENPPATITTAPPEVPSTESTGQTDTAPAASAEPIMIWGEPKITFQNDTSYAGIVEPDVPAYASGGTHRGGLRLVGEQGPELEYTGPSQVYSNSDTRDMFDTSVLEEEIRALRRELKEAQDDMIQNTKDTAKMLSRWDGDGMPAERILIS